MGVIKSFTAGVTALALSAGIAAAATVSINVQSFGSFAGGNLDVAGALEARDAFIGTMPVVASENFDGLTACPAVGCSATPLSTAVGNFSAILPFNTGDSPVAPLDQAVVRTGTPGAPMYGRFSVEGANNQYLDSNDARGILWEVPGDAGFTLDKLAFFLTDVNDSGNLSFEITASGAVLQSNVTTDIDGDLGNGALHLVTFSFSKRVGGADGFSIRLTNTCADQAGAANCSDGFGIDGIVVAAVPLPAAGLLLLGALGGLAAVRGRRRITS